MADDAGRSRLGRGLAALMGDVGVESQAVERAARHQRKVPIEFVHANPRNPRKSFADAELAELTDSIRERGIIQPIVVRSRGADNYEIIAGERRWRAAQMAGLTELPAIVRRVDDETAVAMSLIENIQREDLNPLEEAMALSRLVGEFGLTHQQAAEAVGRSRAAVSNLLRLLELPDEVKALVEQRQLEMGHARSLLALTNRRQLVEVGALVAKKGLSVRDTEALVRRLLARAASGEAKHDAEDRDPDIRRLEEDLADKLGAQVELRHGAKGKGRLVISYHSLDELDGILAHIR